MNPQQGLRSPQDRYRNLFETSSDGIVLLDVASSKVLEVNPAMAKLLGRPSDQLQGQGLAELLSTYRVEGRSGFPCLGGAAAEPARGEVALLDLLGKWRLLQYVSSSFHEDGVALLQVNVREIDPHHVMEREKAESALLDTGLMLGLVMDHIPQAVFWKDRDSAYVGANRKLVLDAGFDSPEQLVGKTDFDMPWRGFAAQYRADDALVMETDTAKLDFEEPLAKADGSINWLRTNKVPLHGPDQAVIGVLVTYEDITSQKELQAALIGAREQADGANVAKSEFLSRMSHELRTPLNSILGFGQILDINQNRDADDKEAIDYILRAGRHLLALINEILDLASIDAGRISLSPEPVAALATVRAAIEMVRPLAASRGIEISQPPGDEELYVRADQQRLRQILLNLLSNAIKYNCDHGRVSVICRRQGEFLVVEVRDTGPGLTPAQMDKLFVPFERLGAAGSDIEGTGIGLALSKKLAEVMQGSIGVESEVGRGSAFWVRLPLTQGTVLVGEQSPDLDARRPLLPTSGGDRRTLLYIEDNASNFDLIQRLLEDRREVRLLSATTGKAGLELARQHVPSLVLLDVNLPDIGGEVVLRRLRADPVTSKVPVIVLSADAMPAQIEKLRAAGANEYLTKPLNLSEFLRVIDAILD